MILPGASALHSPSTCLRVPWCPRGPHRWQGHPSQGSSPPSSHPSLCTSSLLPVAPLSRPSFDTSRPCLNTPFLFRDMNERRGAKSSHKHRQGLLPPPPLLRLLPPPARSPFPPFPITHPRQQPASLLLAPSGEWGAHNCISVGPPCRHNPSHSSGLRGREQATWPRQRPPAFCFQKVLG